MASKTFSSRADEESLRYADALVREVYGVSFAQYCGNILLDSIVETGRLPQLKKPSSKNKKTQAASFIKGFSTCATNPNVGAMSDAEIKAMIGEKYE